MTALNGIRTIARGNRLYEPLKDLTILTSAIAYASAMLIEPPRRYEQGDYLTVTPEQFPIEIRVPLHGPLEAAIAGLEPAHIRLWFHPIVPEEPREWRRITTMGKVILNAIKPVFALFYEQQQDWLRENISSDPQKWSSSICNFARVVRNSASHNDCLNFQSPNSPAVNWHHLHYTPSQNGRLVTGGDLGFGDLLILMVELSDEMDRLGAPASWVR